MLTKQEAADWADALESGKYEQVFGVLFVAYEPRSACSLMVLHHSLMIGPASDTMMASWVTKKIGKDWEFFVYLNDEFRYDFPQIAQIVRQRYMVEVGE